MLSQRDNLNGRSLWVTLLGAWMLVATLAVAAGPANAAQGQALPGDINGDGVVDFRDSRLMRLVARNPSLWVRKSGVDAAAFYAAADLDGDGRITAADRKQYVVLVREQAPSALTPTAGDLNFDGRMDSRDAKLLRLALRDPEVFRRQRGLTRGEMTALVDLNSDGRLAGNDKAAFTQTLRQARQIILAAADSGLREAATGGVELTVVETLAARGGGNEPAIAPTSQTKPVVTAAFAAHFPDAYVKGSGASLAFALSDALPKQGDVLLLAWSDSQKAVVESFAHNLTKAPWRFDNTKLDTLPEGPVFLQVLVRGNNQVVSKIERVVQIKRAPVAPSITFAYDGSAYQQGSGKTVAFRVAGDLPANADVLLLAWNDAAQSLVNQFAQELPAADGVIDAAKLDALPPGRTQLQAFLRGDAQPIKQAALWVDITPKPEPVPSVVVVPAAAFASAQQTVMTEGEGTALTLTLSAAMPEGGDVLVQAWSHQADALVNGFSHEITAQPWQVSAAKLNTLTAGTYTVQALVRLDHVVKSKAEHVVVVQAKPAPTPAPDPTPTPEPQPEPPPPPPPTPTPEPTPAPVTQPDSAPTPDPVVVTTPEPIAQVSVAFAADASAEYQRGSSLPINLSVTGTLPEGGDVFLMAWSDAAQSMIEGFAHSLSAAPWQITAEKLDVLPAGQVELQAVVRGRDQGWRVVRHALLVKPAPGEPEPAPTPDPVAPLPTPTGDGWSTFAVPADARLIYVSASGNDGNNGLSTSTPVRSLQRGYDLLRNGYPDRLLLKAGDAFTEPLPNWSKSGRSASEPMVVGVYGNGDRPRLDITGTRSAVYLSNVHDLFFTGIYFHNADRDHHASQYVAGADGASGIPIGGGTKNILFEDMRIEFFRHGFEISSDGTQDGLTIRRCVIRNNWAPWTKTGSVGIYAYRAKNLRIIENVIDHNGWCDGAYQSARIGFHHNLYIVGSVGLVLENNFVSRGSNNGLNLRTGYNDYDTTHDATVRGNVFFDNAYAIDAKPKNDSGAPPKVMTNINILRNVFSANGAAIGGSETFGIGINVNIVNGATVADNLLLDKPWTNYATALSVGNYSEQGTGPVSNVQIQRNIIHRWTDGSATASGGGITASGNLVSADPNLFIDASRSLAKYAQQAGAGSSPQNLIDAAGNRARGQWPTQLSTAAVVSYLRAGFELKPFD